jgi:hypothetical protein
MAQAAEEHVHEHEDPTPPDVARNQQMPGTNGRHAR